MFRSAELSEFGWANHPRLSIVQADLRARAGLARAANGVDAVLHLAAAKSGDLYAQYAGTVVATENLLAAMSEAGVGRLVLISSFSVYNYLKIPMFSVVTEESPLEKDAFSRDEYSHIPSWFRNGSRKREHAVQHGLPADRACGFRA